MGNANPIGLITMLKVTGSLKPTVDKHIDEFYRHRADGRESWYSKLLKEKGLEIAEAKMDAWIRRNHLREYSEAIEPVATGIMDLAAADDDGIYVAVSANVENMPYRVRERVGQKGKMVIAKLPEWQGCGCSMPDGGSIFGNYGAIPLCAVALGFSSKNEVVLCLVFKETRGNKENSLTFVVIDRNGRTDCTSNTMRLKEGGLLSYSFGLKQESDLCAIQTCQGGLIDSHLGFPEAGNYLAKHIGKLGTYISGLAEHLKKHSR